MEILRGVIPWLQIVLAVAVIAVILLQRNEASLGSAFGGETSVIHTKRGFEKGLFVATIVLAVLFVASSIAALLLQTI
ncbi:MAG: preprotein translocase subunit SecG [Patescibacteria group bacterium]